MHWISFEKMSNSDSDFGSLVKLLFFRARHPAGIVYFEARPHSRIESAEEISNKYFSREAEPPNMHSQPEAGNEKPTFPASGWGRE